MNFSKEQIEKAKNCKSIEEFDALALREGITLSDEQKEEYFNATRTGELDDDELDMVAGGKGSDNDEEWEPKFQEGQKVLMTRMDGSIVDAVILEIEYETKTYKVRYHFYYNDYEWTGVSEDCLKCY